MPYPFKGTSYDKTVYNNVCPSKCSNNTDLNIKLKATTFDQFQGIPAIKREIMTNGPVQAGFTVYDDFFNYSDGVYQATSSTVAGGHAVEIVGWSTDNHGDYWIVKNSWGDGWGMKGFFNIYVDQAEISDEI
jgi:cathepsin B